MKQRAVLLELARVVIVVAVALAISFLVILVVSKQPGEAFKEFITGAAGSRNRVSNWLVQATTKATAATIAALPGKWSAVTPASSAPR